MKKRAFNIVHIVPLPGGRDMMHGLYGYREVVETLAWGLGDLGHDVTISENVVEPRRINVIVGAQMLSDDALRTLPPETIVYNFEQIGALEPTELRPTIKTVAERFRIWDYSERNLPTWQMLDPTHSPMYVRVGWAPILARIEKPVVQDIDVLLYGSPGELRVNVFRDLCYRGIKCVFVCGLYGTERDKLIGRSKLVLNISLNDRSRIFEIVRVSYLLSNSKAVVADIHDGIFVEADLGSAIAFCKLPAVGSTCAQLLDDNDARLALEMQGREAIEKRHISPILAKALKESDLS